MDLQLLENFKNHHLQKHTRFVHGLAKSVREDSRMDPDEKRAREDSKESESPSYNPHSREKVLVRVA